MEERRGREALEMMLQVRLRFLKDETACKKKRSYVRTGKEKRRSKKKTRRGASTNDKVSSVESSWVRAVGSRVVAILKRRRFRLDSNFLVE